MGKKTMHCVARVSIKFKAIFLELTGFFLLVIEHHWWTPNEDVIIHWW